MFLIFWKSEPQRSYKHGSYKKRGVSKTGDIHEYGSDHIVSVALKAVSTSSVWGFIKESAFSMAMTLFAFARIAKQSKRDKSIL